MSDQRTPVDDAVAAAQAQPAQVQMVQRQITIHATGRPIIVAYPIDITDIEMLALVGWVGQEMPALRDQDAQQARSRIVVPKGLVLPGGGH